ncbi:hypothetical protein GDO86_000766 [Hymenochirus boettgeri]|uniref:HECT domain-containing protein n=1 Tax=Hymenochirus boettgeri TaxID=247094 RepID=A0A8T2KIP7_9PIPI|nr:hypothetical protein GDO86_000766 [Hymenochirus boettgeri]
MYCWGDNCFGQLGLSEEEKGAVHFTENNCIERPECVQKVACGEKHTLFLMEDGTVLSCGLNHHGQLCRKGNTNSLEQIGSLETHTIVDISCGANHSVAVCDEGNVFTWGDGSKGQLGTGKFPLKNMTPKKITGLFNTKILQVSCGNFHTISLSEDGRVFSWGQNTNGQLGLGTQIPDQASPQFVKSLKGMPLVQVTAGGSQSFALSMLGTVFAWGKNNAGQLGFKSDPKKAGTFKPYAVNSLRNLDVAFISCGEEHTAVLTKDGSVYTFGDDTYGQLGQYSGNQTPVPQKIEDFAGQVTQVACGSNLFTELHKDKRVSELICSNIKNDLIPELNSLPLLYEAFLIFVLLPESLLLNNTGLSLAVPFAKVVNDLNDNSLKILEALWSSLEAPSLTKQIQFLKNAVMLSVLSVKDDMDPGTKDLLQMLKKLYKANLKAKCIVPISTFCMNELCPLIVLPWDINNWRLWQSKQEPDENVFPAIYCRFPFIFTFITKVQVLHLDSLQQRQTAKLLAQQELLENRMQGRSDLPMIPLLHLVVKRSHLVEDTLHKLSIVEDCNLKKDLLVEFQGEKPLDPGMLKREFFQILFETMINPDYGMFSCSEPLLPLWFPSTPKVEKKRYFFFGILCGLAIYNQVVIYLPFPLALFKKLLGKKSTLEDLKELNPTVGRSMQDLLDADNIAAENMDLYFCISWENKTAELIPNGTFIRVNNSNKQDFVNKYIDWIFNKSVTETYEEFQRGLYKVCNKDIISFFQPEELMTLVAGDSNYDWNKFQQLTIYLEKYSQDHPTIKMFWKVFHALPLDQKKGFLIFVTGNNKVPIFGSDVFAMKISSFRVSDEAYLPEAQTCIQMLFLPEYSNIRTLKKKLLLAIDHNMGYEKI